MKQLFDARSVLVLGVSTSPANMGRTIVDNLLAYRFPGEIHLWGAKGGSYAGHRIHATLDEIPDGLDLAVFLVPARAVPDLLEACGRKGIRAAVIETGGFSELGAESHALEARLVETARRHGIRFLGPNCLGAISFHTGLSVPFMFVQPVFRKGGVALLAQSGGVGTVYLQGFAEANLGLSVFASLGNKLDVSEVDLLDHLKTDGRTEVACLYLEDVKDGRAFYEAARAFPGPVVVQKANTTSLGAGIAQTHTASMAVDDAVFEGMCRQANLVRVPDMKGMVTGAMALALPPMKGRRLGIVSRSGGHAVIAADLAAEFDFELPPLPDRVAEKVRAHTRAGVIRPINPLDLGDLFDFDVYVQLTREMIASGQFDGLAFLHVFASTSEYDQSLRMAHAFRELVAESGLPIAVCFMADGMTLTRFKREAGIPVFASPEDTIRALGLSRDYHLRKARKAAEVPQRPLTAAQIADVRAFLAARKADGRPLTGVDAFGVLERVGVRVAPYAVAATPADAAARARELGGSLVLKLLSSDVSHKSEVGGVVVGLTPDEVQAEAGRMVQKVHEILPDARVEGFLVQQRVRGLREVLIGVRQDPTFGPVVVTGLGGIYTELFKDIAIRLAPLSDVDVDAMMAEVLSFKALKPWRNVPASDVPFLKDVLFRLAHLAAEVPELADFEINPLRVLKEGQGGWVLDARMTVG
jgi:acetyltransferase